MLTLLGDVADFPHECWNYPYRVPLVVEDGRRDVIRADPGQERAILRHLMDAGDWTTTDELAEALFGHREDGGPECENTIRVLISRVRLFLKDGLHIENRYGQGWRLVMDWELFKDTAIKAVQAALVA